MFSPNKLDVNKPRKSILGVHRRSIFSVARTSIFGLVSPGIDINALKRRNRKRSTTSKHSRKKTRKKSFQVKKHKISFKSAKSLFSGYAKKKKLFEMIRQIKKYDENLIIDVYVEKLIKIGEKVIGETINENELNSNTKSKCFVVASENMKTIMLENKIYKQSLREFCAKIRDKRINKLNNLSIFKQWTQTQILRRFHIFGLKKIKYGEYLVKQETRTRNFFIVLNGEFELTKHINFNAYEDYIK